VICGSRLHKGKKGQDNAGSYCDGDTDIAEEHEIVKEVCEELREE